VFLHRNLALLRCHADVSTASVTWTEAVHATAIDGMKTYSFNWAPDYAGGAALTSFLQSNSEILNRSQRIDQPAHGGLLDCDTVWTFSPEDGSSMFLRSVGTHLQVHTASQPRRASCASLRIEQLISSWCALSRIPEVHSNNMWALSPVSFQTRTLHHLIHEVRRLITVFTGGLQNALSQFLQVMADLKSFSYLLLAEKRKFSSRTLIISKLSLFLLID
jgi:hypothetical protein